MNTKRSKGIIGITLAIIMVASIFAVMVPTTVAINYAIGKDTIEGPGGAINNSLTYQKGDTVYYRCNFKPTSEAVWLTEVVDTYPDGTKAVLFTGNFSIAVNTSYVIETNWAIPTNWSDPSIVNDVRFNFTSQLTAEDDFATAHATSFLEYDKPVFDFTFSQACCHNMSFVGTASADVANWSWDFGEDADANSCGGSQYCNGTGNDPGSPWCVFDSYGNKQVTLSGYNGDGEYNSTTKTVYVPQEPQVMATATKTFVLQGQAQEVTFKCDGSWVEPSLTPAYQWTFDDGGTGSSDTECTTTRVVDGVPGTFLTATLTVSDGHCVENNTVKVVCSEEVPAIGAWGILMLTVFLLITATYYVRKGKGR
jgi:hypothetical protein